MKRWSNQNLANVGTEPMDISKTHGQVSVAGGHFAHSALCAEAVQVKLASSPRRCYVLRYGVSSNSASERSSAADSLATAIGGAGGWCRTVQAFAPPPNE